MTRNPSHPKCTMQFKISNSSCLEGEHNLSGLGFNFALSEYVVTLGNTCLQKDVKQYFKKKIANIVQNQCLATVRKLQGEGTVKYMFGF